MKSVRTRYVRTVVAMAVVALATASLAAASGRTAEGEMPVIRFAAATVGLHEAPYFRLDEYARKYGIRVETVPLPSFADKGRALQRGDVDAALIGPTNLAQYAADGVGNVKAVIGGWWGQQWLVARKGSGITSWASLRGKTVGAPPGSYAYIAWLNALREHRLTDAVRTVNTTFDPTTVRTAFAGGTYDAVVFFSPNTDRWVLEGLAEFPRTNFVQDSSLGSATGLVGFGQRLLTNRDLGIRLTRAILDLQNDMVRNRDKWAQITTQIAGVQLDIASFAVQRGCMGYPVEVNAIRAFGAVAADFGVTRTNVARTITNTIDLSYLRTVTGLDERRLISTPACAPEGVRSPTGVLGTAGGERLNGTAGADKIFGLAGNDTINGMGGNDLLDGGGGNDRVVGGDGNDQLVGGEGNDVVLGGAGNDKLLGGPGNDVVAGGGGLNQYNGGDGNDTITSRNGRKETVLCGNGRDRVTADHRDRLRSCEVVRTR